MGLGQSLRHASSTKETEEEQPELITQETENVSASTAISTRDAQAGQLPAPVYLRLTE